MSMADASSMDGVLIVNKAPDMSSAEVVAAVKRLLLARKVGHAGTLDPFATGVLVCCINRATRLARFFLDGRKTYQAVCHLGIETDTQDATGSVVATSDPVAVTGQQIDTVCRQFEGEYWQSPPRYSALKHHGIPLYRYARQGEPVQKPPRRVYIDSIRLQSVRLPLVQFEVACSAGTYIRTLCHDMGKALGCGGHLKALVRLESSGFRLQEAISLFRLKQASEAGRAAEQIVSMESALRSMPAFVANKALTANIKHGRVVTKNEILPSGENNREGLVKVVDEHRHLIAVLGYRKHRQEMQYHCVFN
jgi:tRNA pseudouridine55 synthase